MKPIKLSKAAARRLLVAHHFSEATIEKTFERLGSVQFDPLKPLGCNHDLVLQARVPDYQIDGWMRHAYQERFIYDGWDKQASLVMMKDWPLRRIYHHWHGYWRKELEQSYPEAIAAVLNELKTRGPLTSTQFAYQVHKDEWKGSWYGPKLTKHVLRALWHSGEIATHSRKNGHHVYDLAERIVPKKLLNAKARSHDESLEWLIRLRHQAVGLLRVNAGNEVWSVHIPASERREVIARLVEQNKLQPVEIEGQTFHALPEFLAKLESAQANKRMIFIAPLDPFIWDRKAIAQLFDFDYLWEVYVPEPKRKWGYYVLPVLYKDKLVARFDSRKKASTWEIYSWRWEAGVKPDGEMLTALEQAAKKFLDYLGAEKVVLPKGLDKGTRGVLQAAGK